jgi:Flp pilus assembly protein TadG
MRRKVRTARGAHIVEFAACLIVGLPLLVLLIYAGVECATFYTIKSAMEVGARTAARTLVVKYNTTGTKGTTVDWLSMPNFINDKSQFTVTWDATTPPAFVTVTCRYPTDGSHHLPLFPTGPLRYLDSHAIFDLKKLNLQGTFTVPVQ